ncbi:hypothetical protein HYFRA_00002316 [Hymenoscyphus fraxineus]|uniref:Epoxide hydrolase N-terminal domain-containing protein n=1 Tax=Hymenoscyphus fraxineus TaxID=746836 RepID=A0A9N9L7A9_9HELO|nr:hypothetical protein HYFRA_00002316 [Hymenoscyphus fraxineus]
MDSSITPFKISISDAEISSLKSKLSASIFPDEVDFSNNWDYGTPLNDMQRLAKYWRDGFDWRAQEKILNEMPQFTTKIEVDGFGELDIHFVHQKSEEGSIPLLFCHGWPGSFIEVKKIISLLTKSGNGQSFHVVAPSLPGFGFSDAPKKAGFGIPQYAETVHKLMLKLGYNKYASQGGDWGWSITRMLGVKYPTHCVASHINFIITSLPQLDEFIKNMSQPLTPQEEEGVARTRWFFTEGVGYNILQCTKPNTLAFALRDSPLALLSWIYEKLHEWTDSYPWTDDEILTWISIYQFSKAGPGASVMIYYHGTHLYQEEGKKLSEYVEGVKLGLSYFPKDLCLPPSVYGRGLGEVVFERRHGEGGHFAAYEKPELLVGDLKEMFRVDGGVGGLLSKI